MKKIRKLFACVMALALVGAMFLGSAEPALAADVKTVPIYRLYTEVNGEHLFTSDWNEVKVLTSWDNEWQYEGVAWYAPESGDPVYRLYNAVLRNHLYTTDTNEVKVLTTEHGWVVDNNAQPLFYSGGSVKIYRLYNEGLNGMHLLTTDANEYAVLPEYEWEQEGAKLSAVESGAASPQEQVLQIVNQERAAYGLPELTMTDSLQQAAAVRAEELASLFSHTRPDGTSCFTVLSEYGVEYRSAGENIAAGHRTSIDVMDSWMNSPGHRANILGEDFRHIGIGVFEANGMLYWVQLFTS